MTPNVQANPAAEGRPAERRLSAKLGAAENEMKLIKQKVLAEDVLRMINARLEAVTMAYQYAKGNDRKIEAEAMAETKWQLAELKMQFVDLLTEQLDGAVREHA